MNRNFVGLIALFCILFITSEYANAAEPVINEIIPNKAYVGDEVVIKGENFGKNRNSVFFKSVRARVKSQNSTEITAIVPKGAKVGNVVVESGGVKSNEMKFYVLPYVEFKLASTKIEIGKETKGTGAPLTERPLVTVDMNRR